MPDLASRTSHETAIATALLLFMGRERDSFMDGDDFDMWSFRDGMEEVLVEPLAAVHEEAATNLAGIQGLTIDRFRPDLKSVRWASKYSKKIAREVSRSIRDEVKIAGRLDDPGEFERVVNDIFGRDRAEKIGVTETTSGISIGERSVIDEVERQTGKKLIAYWQIEDYDACKICKGLNNKSESVWRRKYPFGPPSHPFCRCWCEYR